MTRTDVHTRKNTARTLVVTARHRLDLVRHDEQRGAARGVPTYPHCPLRTHLPSTHESTREGGFAMPTSSPMLNDRWMSYTDAAEYLGLSRKTLERAVNARNIPHTRDPLTGRVRFQQSKLDAWMTRRRRP